MIMVRNLLTCQMPLLMVARITFFMSFNPFSNLGNLNDFYFLFILKLINNQKCNMTYAVFVFVPLDRR